MNINEQRQYINREFFGGRPSVSHGFRISEASFNLETDLREQLSEVAVLLPSLYEGVAKILCLSLIPDKTRSRTIGGYVSIRRAFGLQATFQSNVERVKKKHALPEVDLRLENECLSRKVGADHIYKADMVRGLDRRLRIVEVEVDRPHGYGYTTLGRILGGDRGFGKGLANEFAIKTSNSPEAIILSGREQFHEQELYYFARQVNRRGGNLTVIPQRELNLGLKGAQKLFPLPVFQDSNRGVRQDTSSITRTLTEAVDSGKISQFTLQDKILNNRQVLALISNAGKNIEIEQILLKVFTPEELEKMRSYLVPTLGSAFIQKGYRDLLNQVQLSPNNYFVKTVKAGEHEMALPGDRSGQNALLIRRRAGRPLGPKRPIIIQPAIAQEYKTIDYQSATEEMRGTGDFSIRYSLFSDSKGVVLDLALTASPGIRARGSRESIVLMYNVQDAYEKGGEKYE